MVDVRTGQRSERREYFRIDDEVYLELKSLSEREYQALATQPLEHLGTAAELPLQLSALNAQSHNLLASIRKTHPDIAQYLALLEKKTELVLRAVVGSQSELQTTPNMRVNLSGGGLAFHSAHPLSPGSGLELQLMLFPSHLFIHCLGTVVHCDSVAAISGKSYHIGIDFTHISQIARDAIVRHTLELQSAQLRRARELDQD